MRILGLFLSIMTVSTFASANICDTNWLARATGNAVRAFISAGGNVREVCNLNRNTPLHQAILTDGVSSDVIDALIRAGGDVYAENIDGRTPMDYAQSRYDRAMSNFPQGSAAYSRERAIYSSIMGSSSDASSAVLDAHDKLCDLNWWRRSGSGPAVQQLLSIPGVDPDYICNLNNDRIIHQPLKLSSFTMLTDGIMRGIDALVDGGAELYARNNSGDTAVSLAGIRYDRVTARMTQHTIRWCRGEIIGQQLFNEITRNLPDKEAYLYITSSVTGRSYNELSEKMSMELYRTSPNGTVDYRVLCPYRGVNVR